MKTPQVLIAMGIIVAASSVSAQKPPAGVQGTQAGETVTGMVVNEVGRPVENAAVVMMGMSGEQVPARSMTDKSGKFALHFGKSQFAKTVFAWDERGSSEPQSVMPGNPVTLRLRGEGWGKVMGTVVDTAGSPIPGAEISWSRAPVFAHGPVAPKVKTDAQGKFEYPRFWCEESGVWQSCKAEGWVPATQKTPPLRSGGTVELKFTLAPASKSVAGTLMDSRGKPVAGQEVHCFTPNPRFSTRARTDAQGRFRVDKLPAGKVHVQSMWATQAFTTKASRWVEAGDSEIRLVFLAADSEVQGLVVDASGKPIPMATVKSSSRGRQATADKYGYFVLSGLVEGWFTAEVFSPAGILKEVRLRPGLENVTIKMPREMRQQPSAPKVPLDLTGKPAPDIRVATWIHSKPLSAAPGGKVRILDLWGMECPPCLAAFPKMQAFWAKHQSKGLEIVAYTSLFPAQEVKEFLAKHPTYQFPIAIGPDDTTTFLDYDARAIPTYVVIDTQGKIVSKGHDFEEAGRVALKLLGVESSK